MYWKHGFQRLSTGKHQGDEVLWRYNPQQPQNLSISVGPAETTVGSGRLWKHPPRFNRGGFRQDVLSEETSVWQK